MDTLEEEDERFITCDDIPHRLGKLLQMRVGKSWERPTSRRTPMPVNIVFAGKNG
jgi:hypothetical protein